MSYGAAAGLQAAVYRQLAGDVVLARLVGDAIYDALPAGALPETYISLGPEEVRARSDGSGGGAWHRFTVSVITGAPGFHAAKEVAVAVGDALVVAELPLQRGRLVTLDFERARAGRVEGGTMRRIDLRFRARIEDEPREME